MVSIRVPALELLRVLINQIHSDELSMEMSANDIHQCPNLNLFFLVNSSIEIGRYVESVPDSSR